MKRNEVELARANRPRDTVHLAKQPGKALTIPGHRVSPRNFTSAHFQVEDNITTPHKWSFCVYQKPHFSQSVTLLMAGPAPSPHKPRRKIKSSGNGSEQASLTSTPEPVRPSSSSKPTYPLAALLWPARSSLSQWEILPLVLMAVGLFRWAAGLWGYSGTYMSFWLKVYIN
jgi:hypothetical protein